MYGEGAGGEVKQPEHGSRGFCVAPLAEEGERGFMVSYIFRRLVIAFFMLIGIGIVSFIIIKLPPGDFADRYQQYLIDRGSSVEDAQRAAQIVRVQYGLDQPIPTQFLVWVKGIVTEGKFGYSFAYR